MVYITGDTHGNFDRVREFCKAEGTTPDDILIILGDSGINYFTDIRAHILKHQLRDIPITIFVIHGNHEERASNIESYHTTEFFGAKALVEDAYENLIFAIDGEVYTIPTMSGPKRAIAIGGAYSIDKPYRLKMGYNWFESEQPSLEIKQKVEHRLSELNWEVDLVLSHTCPFRYIPTEWFISGIDQTKVDNSTEEWLDTLLSKLNHLETWYCGHYHGEKSIDKMRFLFNSINEL